MKRKLKILFLSAEVAPFSKTGGLADVAGSLPRALKDLGHEVVVATAKHGIPEPERFEFKSVKKNIPISVGSEKILINFEKSSLEEGLPVYFVASRKFFDEKKSVYGNDDARRFYLLTKAILRLTDFLKIKFDIVHCNDWHMGLVPYTLKKETEEYQYLSEAKILFTIHNLEFQGDLYWRDLTGERRDDGRSPLPDFSSKEIKRINFMKRGIIFADAINTVSERYRKEAMSRSLGRGLDQLLKSREADFFGILNGIDYDYFNPLSDKNLAYNFNGEDFEEKKKLNKIALQKELGLKEESVPLLGLVTRIGEQKGFSLLKKIMRDLLRFNLQIGIVGEGDRYFKDFLREIAKKNPGKIGLHLRFSEAVGSRIYGAADLFLMPSLWEPCGLGQMIAMRYGAVPIVRRTGGLFDTVIDFDKDRTRGNGFYFCHYSPSVFFRAISRALDCYYNKKERWQELVGRIMKLRFDWQSSAKNYQKIYYKIKK